MSLEIQDEFAALYARFGHNPDSSPADPHSINHTFQDWFSAWLQEHEHENLGVGYTHSPHPEDVIRKMFGKFFSALRKRNHVYVPRKIQEAAIQEYLED